MRWNRPYRDPQLLEEEVDAEAGDLHLRARPREPGAPGDRRARSRILGKQRAEDQAVAFGESLLRRGDGHRPGLLPPDEKQCGF